MKYSACAIVVVLGIVAGGLEASAHRRAIGGVGIAAIEATSYRGGGAWAGQRGDAGRLELFDDKNFKGKSSALTRPSPELGSMSGHADSLRLSGTWQICDQPNFRGRCFVVSENIADLERIGWKNRIRSARPR